MAETYVVRRAAFSIEDPWAVPPQGELVRLRRAIDGAPPRLATTVVAYFDNDFLNVLFSGADDLVVATHFEHDAPLYEEDVVEVFVAPRAVSEYFEIEVSPRGTAFDARIESPDGIRSTMKADPSWDCDGLFAAVRRRRESSGVSSIDTVLRIPFSSLGLKMPRSGEIWRANFFRIDRHPKLGDEYSAWHPTLKRPADFHVTAAFGTLQFEG
jgi:cellulose/xylan binding protein with CBM9 domain